MCKTTRMSKITFRADDDLIRQLEEFDASKSEVMREALREYLDENGTETTTETVESDSIDALIAERVDDIIADRLDDAFTPNRPQDVNVNITLDGDAATNGAIEADASHAPAADVSSADPGRKTDGVDDENTAEGERKTCTKCGESVAPDHVYCPNCGEKANQRVFCECGDELQSDWLHCPGCGTQTPAGDVLDQA